MIEEESTIVSGSRGHKIFYMGGHHCYQSSPGNEIHFWNFGLLTVDRDSVDNSPPNKKDPFAICNCNLY